MKSIKKGLLLGLILTMMLNLTGCRKPFDKPEIRTIEPSQTAFLVPLEGDTTKQGNMDSMEFLNKAKVATKRVQIPHKWLQTGRNRLFIFPRGEWIPTMRLIVVERKPVTREWTNGSATGTSNRNEGIVTESKDSIGFVVGVGISAQIDEKDAVKFLYRYNNKALNSIMDEEIRTKVENKFNEECGKRTLEEVMAQKDQILKSVKEEVIPYFNERGITITAIGLKGQFDYVDSEIQDAINKKFKAEKAEQSQKSINRMNVEKAQSDQQVINLQKSIMKEKIELMQVENQSKMIDKWDGHYPQVMGGDSGMILQIQKEK